MIERLRLPSLPSDETTVRRCTFAISVFYAISAAGSFQWMRLAGSGANGWQPKVGIWLSSWIPPEHVLWVWQLAAAILAVAALGAAIAPRLRAARVAYCLALLVVMALYMDGKGKIDHGHHSWWWCSFVLSFLPPFRAAEVPAGLRQAFVRIVWTVQAMVLLLYTLAGLSKVVRSLVLIARGRTSWFEPGGLIAQIARVSPSQDALLADFILRHEWLAYGLQLGVLYVELFALVAAFRRGLLRIWGTALVLMHLGIAWTMGIVFSPASMMLLLFVVLSPLAEKTSWRRVLVELPLFGRLLGRWGRLAT